MLNILEPIKLDQNTAISAPVLRECLSILLRVLYPVVPHLTHVLWKEVGYAKTIGPLLDAPWPAVDEAALVQTEITLMLQINGKLRGDIKVPADAGKDQIEALALQSEPAQKALNGGAPKKSDCGVWSLSEHCCLNRKYKHERKFSASCNARLDCYRACKWFDCLRLSLARYCGFALQGYCDYR